MHIDEFADRRTAALAAADAIEEALVRRLSAGGAATLVASGGNSPVETFRELSGRKIDWPGVTIVPSDERWVPPDHPDSNERMLREVLLTKEAAGATLIPFFAEGKDVEERCLELDQVILGGAFPFSCALLGMGEDAHFASLFPDAPRLEQGLDLESERLCIPVDTAASPHRRISLSLAALSRSDALLLLAFGHSKRKVLDDAIESPNGKPVARLLRQKRAPLRILWAP